MDRRTKTTIILIISVILIVAGYRYKAYVLDKNYTVLANTACTASENGTCFIADCDPSDPECEQTPYKKVSILRKDAPLCLLEHTCEDFSCTEQDSCSITYCSEDTLEDGELCANTGTE